MWGNNPERWYLEKDTKKTYPKPPKLGKGSNIDKKVKQGENLDSLKYWNKKEENYVQEIKKALWQTTIQKINEISKWGSLLTLFTTTKKEQDDLKRLRIQIACLVKTYLAKFQNILKNEGLEKEDRVYKKLTNIINFLEKWEELTKDTISILKMNGNEGFDPIKLIARAITHVQDYMSNNIWNLRRKKKSWGLNENWQTISNETFNSLIKSNLSEKQILEQIKGKNITNSTKKYLEYFRNILKNEWISKEEVWLLKKLNNFYNYLTKKEALTEDTKSILIWKTTHEESLAKIIDHLSTYIKRNADFLKKKQKSSWTQSYTSKSTNSLERDNIQKKTKEKEVKEQQNEKKYTTKAELLEQNNDKKIMDSTAGTTEKTDFMKELDNIPQEDILKNIPKETYKEYLKAFIKSPEVEALKLKTDKLISLLSKLFIKDKSNPDLIKLQKIREESPIREEMIINEKQQFQQIIKEQAELTALKSWKVLFEKLGISAINWKVIQKAEGKSYYQYSDANNPKISYQFTPITGEFSISTNNINDETRSIDITGTKQKKLFKIPGFTELMNQADPKTILPDKRLNSYKEIKKVIETKLGENIQHNLWDTEATNIKHEIEKEQLETGIITKIKSGLGLKKEQLNKNTDPGYYSFFAPILKTFKQPNISTNQLKILKQFADRIGERGQFTNWKTPTETNEVVQYTDFKKHIETPRNLIKYALSWEKIRDIDTLQNNREKSKFTIGKIMNRLEKSWGKGGPDDRILDIEKISTLVNLRESPDITRNKEYQSSYNKLLSDIESEYLAQIEPTVRKEEIAYAENEILPKIQNTPA